MTMLTGQPLSSLDPLLRLAATAAMLDSDTAAAIDVRVSAARVATASTARSVGTASTPRGPALLVGGGTPLTRTAVATAYLLALLHADVVSASGTFLVDGPGLELVGDLPFTRTGGHAGFVARRNEVLDGADAIAALEVTAESSGLHRLADRRQSGDGILVVTSPLGLSQWEVPDMVERYAVPRQREAWALHPGVAGFGFDPFFDPLAPLDLGEHPAGLGDPRSGSQDDPPGLPLFASLDDGTAWRLRSATAGSAILAPAALDIEAAARSATPPARAELAAGRQDLLDAWFGPAPE